MDPYKGMIKKFHSAKYKLESALLFLCDNLRKLHQLRYKLLLTLSEDGFTVWEHFNGMYTTPFSYEVSGIKEECILSLCTNKYKNCFQKTIFS